MDQDNKPKEGEINSEDEPKEETKEEKKAREKKEKAEKEAAKKAKAEAEKLEKEAAPKEAEETPKTEPSAPKENTEDNSEKEKEAEKLAKEEAKAKAAAEKEAKAAAEKEAAEKAKAEKEAEKKAKEEAKAKEKAEKEAKEAEEKAQKEKEKRWTVNDLIEAEIRKEEIENKITELPEKFKIRYLLENDFSKKGSEIYIPKTKLEKRKVKGYFDEKKKLEKKIPAFPDYHFNKFSLFYISKKGVSGDYSEVSHESVLGEFIQVEKLLFKYKVKQ